MVVVAVGEPDTPLICLGIVRCQRHRARHESPLTDFAHGSTKSFHLDQSLAETKAANLHRRRASIASATQLERVRISRLLLL
jgi:hypothetical protein